MASGELDHNRTKSLTSLRRRPLSPIGSHLIRDRRTDDALISSGEWVSSTPIFSQPPYESAQLDNLDLESLNGDARIEEESECDDAEGEDSESEREIASEEDDAKSEREGDEDESESERERDEDDAESEREDAESESERDEAEGGAFPLSTYGAQLQKVDESICAMNLIQEQMEGAEWSLPEDEDLVHRTVSALLQERERIVRHYEKQGEGVIREDNLRRIANSRLKFLRVMIDKGLDVNQPHVAEFVEEWKRLTSEI